MVSRGLQQQQQSREVVEINSGRNGIYGTAGLLAAHYQTSADCCGQALDAE
jgi:precorrin-3B methylase